VDQDFHPAADLLPAPPDVVVAEYQDHHFRPVVDLRLPLEDSQDHPSHQVVDHLQQAHQDVVVADCQDPRFLLVVDLLPCLVEEALEVSQDHRFHQAADLLQQQAHQDVVVVECQDPHFHPVVAPLPCRVEEALEDSLDHRFRPVAGLLQRQAHQGAVVEYQDHRFRPVVDLHRAQCRQEALVVFLEAQGALELEASPDLCQALEDSVGRGYRLASPNRPSQVLEAVEGFLGSEHPLSKALG